MKSLSVYMLGQLQIRLDERVITKDFRTDKERALLVFLVVESGRAHAREKLAEMFWPERREGVARTNLRQALAGLRRTLGDHDDKDQVLLISNETVRLNPAVTLWLDVASFNSHLEATMSHPHKKVETCSVCIQRLHEAIDLYRGDFLEAFSVSDSEQFQEWLYFQRERLFFSLLGAIENVVRYYQEAGNYETAQEYARRYVSLAPLEERAHQQLMQLLALTGRRTAAIEQYQRCRRMLKETFNVEPSPETTALYQQISSRGSLAGMVQGSSSEYNRPPAYLTSFVGRQSELDSLIKCLENPVCKLISLSGMPGSGKTRLALEVTKHVSDSFPDGVHYLSLEAVNHPAQMVAAIARTLGVQISDPNNPLPALAQSLVSRKALLLLDNYTHLTAHTGDLVEILNAAPHLKIMLTSQRRLNMQSACLYDIQGLPYPMYYTGWDVANFPALQLFMARAARTQQTFLLNQQNTSDVVRICQLTSGLPLAIELAAAALRDHTPRQIAESLEDGLEVLSTRMNDIPEKHRSMQACLQVAWEGLSEREKLILSRLAVFKGPFTLEAALSICEADQGLLSGLIDTSLLDYSPDQRYTMHKLVQLFMQQKLSADNWEASRVKQRHSQYYLELLRSNEAQLGSVQYRSKALAELEKNLENIRKAVRYAGEQKQEEAFSAGLGSLQAYYDTRPHKSNNKCNFWKIELALQENPGDMFRLPLLQMPSLFYPWCCERTGCLEESNQPILLGDANHQIIQANYQACQVMGMSMSDLLGKDVRALWVPAGDHAVDYEASEVSYQVSFTRPDKNKVPLIVSQTRLTQADEVLFLYLLQVSEEVLDTFSTLDESTQYDPLTGLPNRFFFMDQLRLGIAGANRGSNLLAVYLMDINNLQGVNQSLSYKHGDAVLRILGDRLRYLLRTNDVVSRFGGDEFAFLIPDFKITSTESVALKILSVFKEPFQLENAQVDITANVGVCVYPGGGDTAESLINNANLALERSKELGRGHYYVFEHIEKGSVR